MLSENCCQKCPLLKILLWVQIAHNVYLHFWYIGLIILNTIMLSCSCNCVVVILSIIALHTLVAKLVMAHGVRKVGQCGPNISRDSLSSTTYQGTNIRTFRHGLNVSVDCFVQDLISRTFWIGPNVCYLSLYILSFKAAWHQYKMENEGT